MLLVSLLPNALLVAYVWLLVALGAFTNRGTPITLPDLGRIRFRTDAGGVLLFVLLVILLSALLQPFQVRLVRAFEGYWEGPLGAPAYKAVVAAHERRRAKLERQVGATEGKPTDEELITLPCREQIRRQSRHRRSEARAKRAVERLRSYPPSGHEALPTMLGNALRRSERIAGERYHLDTLHTWPRLYPLVGRRIASEYESDTDSVDAAVNLAVVLVLMAGAGFIAFANDTWMLAVPVATLGLAVVAYRAAVAAAQGLGLTLAVAYDLHRFDMIETMHLGLPADPVREKARNEQLSRFLRESDDQPMPRPATVLLRSFTYSHPKDG